MKSTFICQHCGKSEPRDPRIKKQKYCSSRACQNARRLTSNKVRAKKSPGSCSLRQVRNKRWRDTYPAHEYQKDYRKNHPDYVKRNREMQTTRNKKSQKESPSIIVKTYVIPPQPLRDGAYMGFEVKNGKIVKTYAYMAQRLAQPGMGAVFPTNPS